MIILSPPINYFNIIYLPRVINCFYIEYKFDLLMTWFSAMGNNKLRDALRFTPANHILYNLRMKLNKYFDLCLYV